MMANRFRSGWSNTARRWPTGPPSCLRPTTSVASATTSSRGFLDRSCVSSATTGIRSPQVRTATRLRLRWVGERAVVEGGREEAGRVVTALRVEVKRQWGFPTRAGGEPHRESDDPGRRLPHGPQAGESSRHRDRDWLPHVPGDGHHELPHDWEDAGVDPATCEPRECADDEALRPEGRHALAR